MPASQPNRRNPWAWVPTLYLAEGLPYVLVMTVSVIFYKGLGISNTAIALYTSWLYLPWVIKPLWSPVVDTLRTRRGWIVSMQVIIGAGLAALALVIPGTRAFQYSLALFYLIAFSSATQDISIDGFYLLGTDSGEQSFFIGIRSTFYRIATICGQGLLVMLVGLIQENTGLPKAEVSLHSGQTAQTESGSFNGMKSAESNREELHIVSQPNSVEFSFQPLTVVEAKALIAGTRSNNIEGGFYPADLAPATAATTSSFLAAISSKIERWLKKHWGEISSHDTKAGFIGLVKVRLSKPPGHPLVVLVATKSLNRKSSGDEKDFAIVEGSRLQFNDSNWDKGAQVAVQLDGKRRTEAYCLLEFQSGNSALAWSLGFGLTAAIFIAFALYHWLFLPHPESDRPGDVHSVGKFWGEFFSTFAEYFQKPKIAVLLLFLLLYRFAEAQLVKMVSPFLLDAREKGGMGLTTSEVGFAYGTVGIVALTVGGVLGGLVVARHGLKRWLWPMVLAIHLPDTVFVYLATARPENLAIVNACVAVEQFGYGFGFTAYMLYMIHISRGKHPTAHYAICTGFMALGMMIPGMFSGFLADCIGYRHFFIWVLLSTIPGFIVVKMIPLEPEFGKKSP